MKQTAFIFLFYFCFVRLNAQTDSTEIALYNNPHWGIYRGWGIVAGINKFKSPSVEFGVAKFMEYKTWCGNAYFHRTRSLIASYNFENNVGSVHASAWLNTMIFSFGLDGGYYTNFCCKQAGSIMPMVGFGFAGFFLGYGYNFIFPKNTFDEIKGNTFMFRALIKVTNKKTPFPKD